MGVPVKEGPIRSYHRSRGFQTWLEAKRLAGIPEAVVLYCARHRFSTDAMEGTGNVMAVMDAMGHQSVNTTRIYSHSNVMLIREAIERRNQQLSETVQ